MTRPPIATNAEGAMAYLACSKNCLETLRRQGIVVALGRDWYSYRDLDEAVEILRQERRTIKSYETQEDNGAPDEVRPMAGKRNRGQRSTQELLCLHEKRGGKQSQSQLRRSAAGGG